MEFEVQSQCAASDFYYKLRLTLTLLSEFGWTEIVKNRACFVFHSPTMSTTDAGYLLTSHLVVQLKRSIE